MVRIMFFFSHFEAFEAFGSVRSVFSFNRRMLNFTYLKSSTV